LYFLQPRQAGEEGGRWVEEGQEEVMAVTQANGEEISVFQGSLSLNVLLSLCPSS